MLGGVIKGETRNRGEHRSRPKLGKPWRHGKSAQQPCSFRVAGLSQFLPRSEVQASPCCPVRIHGCPANCCDALRCVEGKAARFPLRLGTCNTGGEHNRDCSQTELIPTQKRPSMRTRSQVGGINGLSVLIGFFPATNDPGNHTLNGRKRWVSPSQVSSRQGPCSPDQQAHRDGGGQQQEPQCMAPEPPRQVRPLLRHGPTPCKAHASTEGRLTGSAQRPGQSQLPAASGWPLRGVKA